MEFRKQQEVPQPSSSHSRIC